MNINIALIFEESPDEEIRKCIYCKEVITGKKYQALLIVTNITATDLFLCEKCYQNSDQFSDKPETI